MPYPTVKTLERLQEFATISGLFEWIRTEQESGIKLNSLDSPDGLTRRMMRK
jgi:hypothetical protein